MPLTTITLSGPLITQANGSITPALPTNEVEKKDLPVPQGYDKEYNYKAPSFHVAILLGVVSPVGLYLIGCLWAARWAFRRNKIIKRELEEESISDHEPGPDPPGPSELPGYTSTSGPGVIGDTPSLPSSPPSHNPVGHWYGDRITAELPGPLPPLPTWNPASLPTPYGPTEPDQGDYNSNEFSSPYTTTEHDEGYFDRGEYDDKGGGTVGGPSQAVVWYNYPEAPMSPASPSPVIPSSSNQPAEPQELPKAALLRGHFELSKNIPPSKIPPAFRRGNGNIYAVCGQTPNGKLFMRLHLVRERAPGEDSYVAGNDSSFQVFDAKSPPAPFFEHRFLQYPTPIPILDPQTLAVTGRTRTTLEPDTANRRITAFRSGAIRGAFGDDYDPSRYGHDPDAVLIADTALVSNVRQVKFRVDEWTAPPEWDHDEIGKSTGHSRPDVPQGVKVETVGTIILNQHCGFYWRRSPKPGVPFYNYDKLIGNMESGNPDLGFLVSWR